MLLAAPRSVVARRAGPTAAAALGAALACAAAPVLAQEGDPVARGVDPIVFPLSPAHDAFLTVEGARTPPPRTFQLGVAADFARGLLALERGSTHLGDLIETRLDLHLLGAIAVVERLELGLDVPFTAYQAHGFDRLEAETGVAARRPDAYGLGDLRVTGRLRLLSEDAAQPLTLALVADGRAPTGDTDSFLGERGAVLAPRVVAERTFVEHLRIALAAGYRWRSEAGRALNLYIGDEIDLGLAGAWALPASGALERWSAIAELRAATPARAPFTVREADALKTPVELVAGLRGHLRGGLFWLAGGGTGIAGDPGYGRESFRLFAALGLHVSLPEPPGDRDGDGVKDPDDACPDVPGPEELDGCPDRDKDEIPDPQDACPDEPGPAARDGCPTNPPLAMIERDQIVLGGTIAFDTDRSTLRPESLPVVDAVAAILLAHPEIRKVRIEGHTDSRGSVKYNHELSRRRAAAVAIYLTAQGIAEARMLPWGHGEDRPISENETALGRAKNRRVEFHIIEREAPGAAPAPPP